MPGPEQAGFAQTEGFGEGLTGQILRHSRRQRRHQGPTTAAAGLEQHRQNPESKAGAERCAHQRGGTGPEREGEQPPRPAPGPGLAGAQIQDRRLKPPGFVGGGASRGGISDPGREISTAGSQRNGGRRHRTLVKTCYQLDA